jgi:hypothetical protein
MFQVNYQGLARQIKLTSPSVRGREFQPNGSPGAFSGP